MTFETLLGTTWPILQAPMAGSQGSALAIAVSEAGGLGALPGAMLDADALRRELAAIRAKTNKPFNVNFFCHQPPQVDEAIERAWRERLKPYFAEYGLDSTATAVGARRAPFAAETAEILAEFEPPIVSFHFGLPEPALLERVRRWGARILSSATTVAEALWLEQRGVDAIIAQGAEAGGHRGMFLSRDVESQVGTFALVPQIARSVRVPVIAAGGIANAAGVLVAVVLGAVGVQIGTAYLLCPEATPSAVHRAALESTSASVTAFTNLFSGRPARGIVNRLMRELGPMSPGVPPFPLASGVLTALRAAAEKLGRGDFSPLWAGQNVSGCREVPAAELTRELASGLS